MSKFKVVNLKYLCERANIPHQKVYDNIVAGKYNSLDFNDKTLLANALHDELKDIFKQLGFVVQLKRLPKEVQT